MSQVLIIEDEVLLAKSLARSLTGKGYDCVTAHKAEEGLRLLDNMSADVVLIDLQLPGMTGFEAMKKIHKQDPDVAIIVVTAYGTMASVVEAMRAGASDFLRKPIDTDELALAIERALANVRLKHTVAYYQSKEIEKTDENRLVGKSSKMKKVIDILDRLVAMELPNPSDYPPVLIVGETGTGKDLLARKIHFHGKFSAQPFVEVNCSNLPKGLEEAELFGYEKGAFTGADRLKRGLFETADGGTIFLNEIGDLNPEAQVKLLQVIERKSLRRVGGLRDINVDVRIIAASNRDLEDKSLFRDDLYHRLNNVKIEIPPLNERENDILELAELFLNEFNQKYDADKSFSNQAKQGLLNYPWPGNVRELRQLIERVSLLSTVNVIEPEDLGIGQKPELIDVAKRDGVINIDLGKEFIDLELIEKDIIVQVLRSCGGNVSEAARKLNIGREALRYRIKKFNISKLIDIIG
jgi:two-component system response regulator AtoC